MRSEYLSWPWSECEASLFSAALLSLTSVLDYPRLFRIIPKKSEGVYRLNVKQV